MPALDKKGIAQRIRGLLAGQDLGVIGATAARLGVSELALRMSIDDLAPHPTLDVLCAIVATYGVDPKWLVTGAYDSETHRQALRDEVAIASLLMDLAPSRISQGDGRGNAHPPEIGPQ